ncbi:MAG: hypothetical protein QXZ48_09150 [Zestosphaera sp.]
MGVIKTSQTPESASEGLQVKPLQPKVWAELEEKRHEGYYLVIKGKTYPIKEQLKAHGFKWDGVKWIKKLPKEFDDNVAYASIAHDKESIAYYLRKAHEVLRKELPENIEIPRRFVEELRRWL